MLSSLVYAFAQFGARPKNRQRSRSAIADDGALVLSCSSPHFRRHRLGVLRYEDALSRPTIDRSTAALLGEHLTLARDGQLPIRMIVIADPRESKQRHRIYARPDVIGKLIEFDGDRFIVDFTRLMIETKQPEVNRKRRR